MHAWLIIRRQDVRLVPPQRQGSSIAEQRFHKAEVVGANPTPGTMNKIAILGFGREGQSVYKYVRKSDFLTSEIWVLDQNPKIKAPRGVHKQLGKNYLRGLEKFDLIFRSPGIPYNKIPPLIRANKRITSLTKLFLQKCPCLVIGITGSKGKGTTATLLYLALKKCGFDAYLTGNIGQPALEILPRLKKNSVVVLEISSFQLQDIDRAPQIAVVVDVFPDHLDAHKDLKEYYKAKAQIAQKQQPSDVIFYLADNKLSTGIAKQSPGRRISVWRYLSAVARRHLKKHLQIPGTHNFRNAQAAYAVAKYLGCPHKKIIEAFSKFRGNEHRLEYVRTVGGVKYYNDSANTTPEGAVAAAQAFKEPKIIIAGGKDKGLDYKSWNKILPRCRIRALLLMGENKKKILKALANSSLIRAPAHRSPAERDEGGNKRIVQEVKNLKEAVGLAKKLAKPGDVVILSPGAASFDMFKSYADRGQKFKQLVKSL